MKLHLPKALFTAVIAAFAVSSTVWGAEVELNNQQLTWSESTTEYEGDIIRMTNGTTITMTGGDITMDKLRIHDLNVETIEVFTLQGGTLNVIDADTGSGTGNKAITIGHWSAGTGKLNVEGGTLNVLNGTVRVGWDSAAEFSISSGTANIKGIEFSEKNNSASLNLTGGRLNIGTSGIVNNGNQSDARVVNLTGGTLGALDATGWQLSGINTYIGNITIDTDVVGAETPTGANILLFGQLSKSENVETATIDIQGSGSVFFNQTFTGNVIKAEGSTASLKIQSYKGLDRSNESYSGYNGSNQSGFLTADYSVINGTSNFDKVWIGDSSYELNEGIVRANFGIFVLNGVEFVYTEGSTDVAASATSFVLKNNGTLGIATSTANISGGISIEEGIGNIKLTGSDVSLATSSVSMATDTRVNYVVDAATLNIDQESLAASIKSISLTNGATAKLSHAFASLGTESEKVSIELSGDSLLSLNNGNTWAPRNLWADITIDDTGRIGGSSNGDNSTVRGTISGVGQLELVQAFSTNQYTIASTIADGIGDEDSLSVKISSGKVRIQNAGNTYSGGTTLAGGELTIEGAKALGTGSFTVSGGALILNTDTDVASYVNNLGSAYMDLQNHTLTVEGDVTGNSTLQVKNGTFIVKGNLQMDANLALVKTETTSDTETITTGAEVHLYGKDNSIKVMDLSNSNNSVGKVVLKEQSVTKITNGVSSGAGALWMNANSYVVLEKDASLSWENVKVTGADSTEESKISTTANQNLYLSSGEATIANAKVEVEDSADINIAANLSNSSLFNNGTGTLTVSNASTSLTDIYAVSGSIVLNNTANTVSNLSISSGNTVSGTADVTVKKTLEVAQAADDTYSAFSLTGSLTLNDGVVVNLTGLSISEDEKSYTLGYASGGIVLDGDVIVEGISLGDGWNYSIAAVDPNAAAGIATLADGANTNTALVLTLTKDSADTATTLTSFTVAGATAYDAANAVLTLQTTETATDYVFDGTTIDAKISDSVWNEIMGEYGDQLAENISVILTSQDGKTIYDFNGDSNNLTAPTLTLNGVTPTPGFDEAGQVSGTYVTAYIPEPTTTTLSLLALAGLAVRRRRR